MSDGLFQRMMDADMALGHATDALLVTAPAAFGQRDRMPVFMGRCMQVMDAVVKLRDAVEASWKEGEDE